MGHGRVPGDQVRVDGVAASLTRADETPREDDQLSEVSRNTRPSASGVVIAEVNSSAEELLDFLVTEAFGRGVDGVEWLYQLASSRMRSKLGDLTVFKRAFSNDLYAPLLSHQRLKVTDVTTVAGAARAQVEVEGSAGEVATFVLALKLNRHGASAGRWQLSGVAREGVDL